MRRFVSLYLEFFELVSFISTNTFYIKIYGKLFKKTRLMKCFFVFVLDEVNKKAEKIASNNKLTMAAAISEKDKTVADLKKKNDALNKETERLTGLLKQSERKRRKQKIVYEKNMENLSIRLADFENNLRKEQKEIQELITKKDKQIKVREELSKTLREKLAQQHCSQCGYPNAKAAMVDLDWELEIDDERNEVIKKLPPLDLPPPEEPININHRPFRPKSKLSPVMEESEVSFGSASLRSIHADLNPGRFHAALTASLSLLDEADGSETPTNSGEDVASGTKSNEERLSPNIENSSSSPPASCSSATCSSANSPATEKKTGMQDGGNKKLTNGNEVIMSDVLSSFCDRLCLNTLKLVNEKVAGRPKVTIKKEHQQQPTHSSPKRSISPTISMQQSPCLQLFSMGIVIKSLEKAKMELERCSLDDTSSPAVNTTEKEKILDYPDIIQRNSVLRDRDELLRSSAVKFANSFIPNNFTVQLLNEEVSNNPSLFNTKSERPDSRSNPDTVSSMLSVSQNELPTKVDLDETGELDDNEDADVNSIMVNGNLNETEGTQSPANGSKKKKKKKKKKRKSTGSSSDSECGSSLPAPPLPVVQNGSCEVISKDSCDFDADISTFERIKSPAEDKFSLMLDEQLDVLDEVSPVFPTDSGVAGTKYEILGQLNDQQQLTTVDTINEPTTETTKM